MVSEKSAKDYIKEKVEPIAVKFLEGKKITKVESKLLGWYPFFNLEGIYGHNNIRTDSSI